MKKRPYIVAMVILVALYLGVQARFHNDAVTAVVSTVLAIVAAVAFWMEFRSNERINEAQLIMELNDQFISNENFTQVEWALEKYYVSYEAAKREGRSTDGIELDISLDISDKSRQQIVNYLVHLEGVAALVSGGVLHLDVITNLMAYRYFIAVNNPVIQKKELIPYRDYYRGIFQIYEKWSDAMGAEKVPMYENALVKANGNTAKRRIGMR